MSRCAGRGLIHQLHFLVMLVVGIGVSASLLATLSSHAAETPVPAASPEPAIAMYDSMHSEADEDRARYGDIFVGTVVATSGKEELPTSDPSFSTTVYFYDVEVEETLNGNASDQVRIRLYGADLAGPEFPEAQKLSPGGRYMFFGGFISDEGYYSVAAGRGVIPITNDDQSVELVATFAPLIREADRAELLARQARPDDPCEQPEGAPSIAVEPQRGPVGTQVRLTGGPFIRPEAAVWWDGNNHLLGSAPIGMNCTTETTISIPKSKPGEYRIIVQDAGGNSAEVEFQVVRK